MQVRFIGTETCCNSDGKWLGSGSADTKYSREEVLRMSPTCYKMAGPRSLVPCIDGSTDASKTRESTPRLCVQFDVSRIAVNCSCCSRLAIVKSSASRCVESRQQGPAMQALSDDLTLKLCSSEPDISQVVKKQRNGDGVLRRECRGPNMT